ncbi:hypothetical protein F2Q68_00019051 [Brassica cretica]|uniref:No apical meristem-associated C-terminal domain-containing protein n=1 Tax=Brassica cretica TaxID=69181 RepID=A0A8S9FVI0_BRACR|nr:hypothetical protein F2Q68_00019051 [Brassica cretica]
MRGKRRSVSSVCFGSALSFSRNLSIFISEKAILSLSVVLRRMAIIPLFVAGRRTDDSLSLSLFVAPRGNESSSSMAVVEGGKSLIISLFVGLLDGEGPLSLCVDLLESKALVDGDIWISVGGSPQRRRSSLSMALRDSLSSQVNENNAAVDDDGTCRPPSVKVAKARGKKPLVERKELSDFQTMWSIKKEDLAMKEKLSKMNLLESLVAKQVPLADYEEALKKKLINELM